MHAFHALLTALSVLCALQVVVGSTLSVYHQRDGHFIKRGDIVGLPGVPTYQPTAENTADPQSGTDTLYQIKIKDEATGAIMLSSAKYCHLVGSRWNDLIRVHLDDHNKVYHIDYHAQDSTCKPLASQQSIEPFTTEIHVVKAVRGPTPQLGQEPAKKRTAQASRSPADKDVPVEQEVVEEKTFFQKYWYIILGGAFILLSNLSAPPEEERPPARQ